jgi:hypothetical protein
MGNTRLAGLLFAATLVATPLEAQSFSLSFGPAIRTLDRGTSPTSTSLPAYALDVALGFSLASALSLRVGAGFVVTRNQNAYAPLPPGSIPCDCYASEDVSHARLGLAYERGPFLFGAGAVLADGGVDAPRRLGALAELRLQPHKSVPLDIGVIAYGLPQSTGRHRAIVAPSIGLRF